MMMMKNLYFSSKCSFKKNQIGKVINHSLEFVGMPLLRFQQVSAVFALKKNSTVVSANKKINNNEK